MAKKMTKEEFFKRFYEKSKKLRIDFDRNMDYRIADLYNKIKNCESAK